jgi:hypothetical protein
MLINIPRLGQEITLAVDWSAPLEAEYRNYDIYCHLNQMDDNPVKIDGNSAYYMNSLNQRPMILTLRAGTVLSVERIYIKKGAPDYDSITFRIKSNPDKAMSPKKAGGTFKGKLRFWVKLDDANRIVCARPDSDVDLEDDLD